jgi:hypothetical protein
LSGGDAGDPRVLEALLDYYDYKKNSSGDRQSESDKRAYREILLARAQIGGSLDWRNDNDSAKLQPHEAADPHWFGAAVGESTGGAFLQFDFGPAVHDLMTRDEGFSRFSEIEVLSAQGRVYSSDRQAHAQVDALKFFNMVNLVPFESYDKELSWHVGFELTPRKEIGRADVYRVALDPALGYGFGNEILYAYALLASSFESAVFSGAAATVYVGPEIGSIYTPREHLKIHLALKHLVAAVAASDEFNQSFATLKAFYSPTPAFDYGIEALAATANGQFPVNWSEVSFKGQKFF